MTERYCEGERFTGLSFAGEIFERCDFADCLFVDYSFTKCELDHTTLNECRFVRCEITGLRSASSPDRTRRRWKPKRCTSMSTAPTITVALR